MTESASLLQEQISDQKIQIQDLERSETELKNSLEREKALYEGKIQFLNERIENLKSEVTEKNQKLENTIN